MNDAALEYYEACVLPLGEALKVFVRAATFGDFDMSPKYPFACQAPKRLDLIATEAALKAAFADEARNGGEAPDVVRFRSDAEPIDYDAQDVEVRRGYNCFILSYGAGRTQAVLQALSEDRAHVWVSAAECVEEDVSWQFGGYGGTPVGRLSRRTLKEAVIPYRRDWENRPLPKLDGWETHPRVKALYGN